MAKPFLLDFQPGIQRDGTPFDATRYLDGLWCRWRLGRPRKMGGYRVITDRLAGLPRKIHMFYRGDKAFIHVGSVNGIQQVVIDTDGNLVSIADRTPASFTAGSNIGFTMDAIFDTTSNVVQLMVHSVPDQGPLATPISTVPFIGQIDSPSVLAQFSDPVPADGTWIQPSISGGIVSVQPYVFDFDSNGRVQWSAPNLPLYLGVEGGSSGAGNARISAQKIVAGQPIRGGGTQSPGVVFWSLSEVITGVFIGGDAGFRFTTVSPSSSILSSGSVIEYDSLYFWAGVDRFLVYNGVVTEVPNTQNLDWFFKNLTPGYESRVFSFKVPRYGEIWWCAPMFGSDVPNYAAIFNVRENCWYDTALPNSGRGAGYFAQGLRFPVMAGVEAGANGYRLWQHEYGYDQLVDTTPTAIRSYFETAWFGGPKNDPPDDRGISLAQLEPDFIQQGDLSAYLIGSANARAPEHDGQTIPVVQIPGTSQQQFASFTERQSHRLTRLHVESDTLGGYYETGRNIMHGDPAEARMMS